MNSPERRCTSRFAEKVRVRGDTDEEVVVLMKNSQPDGATSSTSTAARSSGRVGYYDYWAL